MEGNEIISKKYSIIIDKNKNNEKLNYNSFLVSKGIFKKIFNYPSKLILIFKIFIFFHLVINISANQRLLESHFSYVILSINQKGYQQFLGEDF